MLHNVVKGRFPSALFVHGCILRLKRNKGYSQLAVSLLKNGAKKRPKRKVQLTKTNYNRVSLICEYRSKYRTMLLLVNTLNALKNIVLGWSRQFGTQLQQIQHVMSGEMSGAKFSV